MRFLTVLIFLLPLWLLAQGVDTKNIALDLRFNWQTKQAKGTAEILLSPTETSDEVWLDAGFLTIFRVTLNNRPLDFENQGKDAAKNLKIKLDRNYAATEEVNLRIEYETTFINHSDPFTIGGSFGKGLRFFEPTSTTPMKRKQIWSNGQPEGNKYWFPCNEELSDFHQMEVKATIEKEMTAISCGNLVSKTENADGSVTFHYRTDLEIANYLVFIAVGKYQKIVQKAGKTTIITYGYPDEMEAVKETVVLLPKMLTYLENKIGTDYPFSTYTQVVVQDYPFPGMTGQSGAVLLSDNYIDDYGVHKDFKYLWDGVAVQALANQWFGSLLAVKDWKDHWLNAAFAQYFAGLFTTKDNGLEEYLLWYYPYEKGSVLGAWNADDRHPIVPDSISELQSFNYDNYAKFQGALVLRMLQNEVGEAYWWKTIQSFVAENARGSMSTLDFQKTLERVCGKSMQWFFDQWIYKLGMPNFEISKEYDRSSKQLKIVVQQTLSSDAVPTSSPIDFFQGSILIEIDGALKKVNLKAQKENVVVFPQKKEPMFVNFNVQQSFFGLQKEQKTAEEHLALLKGSQDVLAKQNSGNYLVTLCKESDASADLLAKVQNALMREVNSKAYWRYRMWALGALSKVVDFSSDQKMQALLLRLIRKEEAWLKAAALGHLGNTKLAAFLPVYTKVLQDVSDRVINAAAIAIGKTGSPEAYALLMELENQKSWKNQNRISALNGLQWLGDPRGVDYALQCIADKQASRWYLATPVWDYPFAAVNTLVSLGQGELAYPILFERFTTSLQEGDINDIFQNVQLIDLLQDKRAAEMYAMLKEKFKNDETYRSAIEQYEQQYIQSIQP